MLTVLENILADLTAGSITSTDLVNPAFKQYYFTRLRGTLRDE